MYFSFSSFCLYDYNCDHSILLLSFLCKKLGRKFFKKNKKKHFYTCIIKFDQMSKSVYILKNPNA